MSAKGFSLFRERTTPTGAGGGSETPAAGPAPSRGTERWFVLAAAVALLLRALLWRQHLGSPFAHALSGDEYLYWTWAARIAGGEWLPREVFYTGPLFPYFLGLLIRAVPAVDKTGVAAVHLLLNWITCLMLLPLLRGRLERRTILVAATLALFFAPGVFFALKSMPTTLGCLLLIAGLTALPADAEPRMRRCLPAGILLGLAVLAVPSFIPAIGAAAVFLVVGPGRPRRLLPALALVSSAVLAILPATVSNYLQDGSLVLVSANSGFCFYVANNPQARGAWCQVEGVSTFIEQERKDTAGIAERETGRRLDARGVSQYFLRQGQRFLLDHPGQGAILELRKAILLTSGLDIPLESSLAKERRDFLPLLWAFPVGGTAALLFASLGMTAGGLNKGLLLPILTAAALGAICLIYLVALRYAFPAYFFLLPVSAVGILSLPSLATRPWKALVFLPVACAAVLTWDALREPWWEVNDYLPKLVSAYEETGDRAMVVNTLERMVRIAPDSPFVFAFMGDVYRSSGEPGPALLAYGRSLELNPDQMDCRWRRSTLLRELGRGKEARADLARILEKNPDAVEARAAFEELRKEVGGEGRSPASAESRPGH